MASTPLDIRRWLQENAKCARKKDELLPSETLTHVILNGGVVHIPVDKRGEFLEVYAKCVVAGLRISNKIIPSITERTSGGTYNMFADMDVKELPSMFKHENDLVSFCLNHLPDVMWRPDEVIVICQKQRLDAKEKIGVHLHWPGLRVTDAIAKLLRKSWIDNLESTTVAVGDSVDSVDWESIIDVAVYNRNGIRLPWAPKKNSYDGDFYFPTMIVRNEDDESIVRVVSVEELHNMEVVHKLLCSCSIRAVHDSEVDDADAVSEDLLKWAKESSSRKKTDTCGENRLSSSDVVCDLVELRRKTIEAIPDEFCTSGTFRLDGGRRYDNNIVSFGSNCRFCKNIGRAHRSNRVYFTCSLDTGRIYQKCHDPVCQEAQFKALVATIPGMSGMSGMSTNHHKKDAKNIKNTTRRSKTPKDIATSMLLRLNVH